MGSLLEGMSNVRGWRQDNGRSSEEVHLYVVPATNPCLL